jgi:hypothetical protein
MGNEVVRVTVNSRDLAETLRKAKEFNPKLATAVRRRIRNAGKLVMRDVQEEIRSYPADKYSTGMRGELAESLAVRIMTSVGSKQGVRIVSTGSKLPGNKKVLARAMNAATVRHPVFGRGYMSQPGMRFFSAAVINRHKQEAIEQIRLAVDEAVESMK